MGISSKENKGFICYDCFRLQKCKEPIASWLFFFIALIATISIRAVNIVLDFNIGLAKTFWYVGIGGMFVFFIYKYKYHNVLQRELNKAKLIDKVLSKEKLSDHDYKVLGTILCKLSSKKDKMNFFFIFLSSGLALAWAIYIDFIK